MVHALVQRGMTPGVIATSPLVRCVETAQIVAAGLPAKPELVELDALRPGSRLGELLHWTERQARKQEEVAWVGHVPDVGRLAAALIGEGDCRTRFAKGAIAAIRFDGPPTLGSGELQWLVTAKVLGL